MRTLAWMWLASLAVLGACAEDAISPNPARLAQRQPFASTSASDCPACVLGPKTYVRGNSTPLTKIDSFAGDPEADYVIDIDDNSTRGADGRVVLNGQEILAPRKEGETGARHVRVPVRLLSSNSLATRLTGAPGSTLTIRIEGGGRPCWGAGRQSC